MILSKNKKRKSYYEGETRQIRKFAWFPTKVKDPEDKNTLITIWLEWYLCEEKFTLFPPDNEGGMPFEYYAWKTLERFYIIPPTKYDSSDITW